MLSHLFLLLFGTTLIITTQTHEDGHNPYHHVEILGPKGNYRLEWQVDWETERILFNVTVKTLGFIELGITKDDPETNPDSFVDLIIGGVDVFGKPYFSDRYKVGDGISVEDDKQDWILHTAWENGSHTFLSFSRPFDTGDPQDILINDDTRILIWAYGITDFEFAQLYHLSTRGSLPVYLRDLDLTPLYIQEDRNGDHQVRLEGSDVDVWSIRTSFKLSPKRTTYWCTIHKKSFTKKQHIIGMTFNISNETPSNQFHLHHMLLFRCELPNPSSIYEQFVNHPGEECYSQAEQLGKIPFGPCGNLKAIYAISIRGRSVFLPETVGIPVGESGQTEYYLLQAHYDNPGDRSDIITEVQLDIYHTSRLRPNDAGIMNIGHSIPGSPSILVPAGSKSHEINGFCSPACTKKMLPDSGIKIVAGLLHSHNAGRRVAIQHFRGDEELPYILNDDNWKRDFQPERLLRNEVTILPGDKLQLRCYYEATNRTVVGGYGTDQEMCTTLAIYYNNLVEYSSCWSELISPEDNAHYLAGTRNMTWDQSRLEFMATDPASVAGMTISEISDSPLVNWTTELRKQLQRDHILYPNIEICLSHQEYMESIQGKV